MPRQMTLAIVGVDYPNRKPRTRGTIPRRFEIAACVPGEPVELVLEPDNPADANAIMIFSARGVQIGYVTAERAPLVGKHIRQGDEVLAVFQGVAGKGAWIRVSLDGSEPELPPPTRSRGESIDDSGFVPDPIWDDD